MPASNRFPCTHNSRPDYTHRTRGASHCTKAIRISYWQERTQRLYIDNIPSKVEVSYLVPMSEFNSEPYVLKAYVDYNEARHARNGKLKVTMSLMPELYRNASMTPDSVEYIIEPKRAQ